MSAIHDVRVVPLKVIPGDLGSVMHVLRSDAPHFERFGEVYISGVNPGVTKGWKVHARSTSNLAVVHGRVRFVLHDPRAASATHGAYQEVVLAPEEESYRLLVVPPGVALAWQNLGADTALIVNCATEVHAPGEGVTLPLETYAYEWGRPIAASIVV